MELNWDSLISIHQNFSVLQSTLQNFWLTHELKINPIYSKMADINDWEPFHLRWFDFLVVDILLHKKMAKTPGQGSGNLSFIRHTVCEEPHFPICKCTSCFKVLLLLLLLLSCFSRVQLCATPEKAAHQAPLSLGFSRQEYWSKLPFEDFIFNKLYIISPELHRNFIFHPFCSHTHKKLSCSPELSCSAPVFSFTLRPNYC